MAGLGTTPRYALVDALAAAGKGDAFVAIIDGALARAEAGRRAAFKDWPLRPAAPPDDPQRLAGADALQASFWITEFAFSLTRRLASVLPTARPALREALDRAHSLISAFSSLGDAMRHFQLVLSGYFETEADWICAQERGIRKELA